MFMLKPPRILYTRDAEWTQRFILQDHSFNVLSIIAWSAIKMVLQIFPFEKDSLCDLVNTIVI